MAPPAKEDQERQLRNVVQSIIISYDGVKRKTHALIAKTKKVLEEEGILNYSLNSNLQSAKHTLFNYSIKGVSIINSYISVFLHPEMSLNDIDNLNSAMKKNLQIELEQLSEDTVKILVTTFNSLRSQLRISGIWDGLLPKLKQTQFHMDHMQNVLRHLGMHHDGVMQVSIVKYRHF